MTRLRTRKVALTTQQRADKARKRRYIKGQFFVDPFPIGFGTLPEKIVYRELSLRGVPFLYLNTLDFNIPEIDFFKQYQADFVIPELKLIIEVQGSYWHSTVDAIESDAFKFSVYEMLGYRALAWWDYDIQSRIGELIAADPQLSLYAYNDRNSVTSELAAVNRPKTDTSQGIRTNNYKTKQKNLFKKRAARLKRR